jgi:superfamily II DNA/RNA helicase
VKGRARADADIGRPAWDVARDWGLDGRLVPMLKEHGVRSFFAVQARTLPYLISSSHAERVRDAVVCAPTGSGKTLVYVLAVLQVSAGATLGGRLRGTAVD